MNEQDRLIGYLHGRDVPCPECGYNLRGLQGTECPECGQPVTIGRIKYHRPSPWTGSFVSGALGLICGFLVLLAVWPEVMNWDVARRGEPPGVDDLRFVALLGSTLGMVVLAAKWIDWSDEMPKRSARFRRSWVAACWLAPLLMVLLGWSVGRW